MFNSQLIHLNFFFYHKQCPCTLTETHSPLMFIYALILIKSTFALLRVGELFCLVWFFFPIDLAPPHEAVVEKQIHLI